jgi:hypothetical protein
VKVENTVTDPSSHPQARTPRSGENSKAKTDPFEPTMVFSRSYWRADMEVEDEVSPGFHVVSHTEWPQ